MLIELIQNIVSWIERKASKETGRGCKSDR